MSDDPADPRAAVTAALAQQSRIYLWWAEQARGVADELEEAQAAADDALDPLRVLEVANRLGCSVAEVLDELSGQGELRLLRLRAMWALDHCRAARRDLNAIKQAIWDSLG